MSIHYTARFRTQFLGTIEVTDASSAEESEKKARQALAEMITFTPADPEWPCTKDHHKIATITVKTP